MSSKEVKLALKNARDAIKNKEFKEALKHCKAVLKLEKNNYNAWVFIGVAASELDQPEQAQTAYRKALELEPEQLLAWQGLANLYEKSDLTDYKAELPNVYQKLIELYESSDKTKFCLSTALALREPVGRVCGHLLLSASVEEQDNETQQHVILAFEKAMVLTDNVPGEDHRKLSADYVKCLSKLPHEEGKMKEACESMLALYPSETYPLEVLCAQHLKSGTVLFSVYLCLQGSLDPDSGLCQLGLGIRALEEGKCEDAVKHLARGEHYSLVGWCSLAQAQLKMHRYSDCVTSCSQGTICVLSGLKLSGSGDDELGVRLQRLRLEALVRTGDENTADTALETLDQVQLLPDAKNDPFMLSLKGRAYLQKGQVDLAFQVSFIRPAPLSSVLLIRLKYLLQAAAQSPACGEYHFLLGRLYWGLGEECRRDRSKAHNHLLKAAKLDPYLGAVFRYLGHYYREVARDRGRARGCYRRAFELDGSDAESGSASVDLSMEQGDMDTALAVLQSVVERATPGSAKWAWMRRGLYHLKVGQNPQACADLQAALRADPQDWVCWECLGEAYLNRRSFTAALKAFAKAQLLNPSSIYSLYQMAAIKQTLGKFKEAAAEYLQVTAREDYVPALKGLGECLLSLAKGLMEDCRDGGAIDLIQRAINHLFRAVELRPDLSCLWKLLGDACTTVSTVAPSRARVVVPGPLTGLEPPDQEHLLNQGQVLRVGERCYGRAIKLMPQSSNLWYDLGLNFYHQARLAPCVQGEEHSSPLFLEKALQCVKKAIMLNSSNHSYWNTLGVVAMSRENYALAQHSFIKSVQVEPNNVVAWTNLGALYLKKENVELSHEAFKIAQSLEPLYVNCWIGQALIAETVGSYDTMDLFRHTTELSTHMEGVKGYAHWVCATLLDKSNRDSELYRYNIVQMNAVSAAQVSLSKYTERIQTDPVAFIMLGFLNEHLQLKKQAVLAYQRCSLFLCVCVNTGQWEEAVRVYSSTPLEELHDLVGLALAYYRAGGIAESISAYEKALTVAPSEKEKAYVLTGLALLQHRLGNMDPAKTLLFKCSMLKEPVAESLLCLCALGLVRGDSTLASAALSELLKQGGATAEQRCLLTCALLAVQGNYSGVQREASRAVHSNPGNPSMWALLSRLVPQYSPRKANVRHLTSPCRSLLYSGVNQLACGRHSGDDRSQNALKTIQRAVLLCPGEDSMPLNRPLRCMEVVERLLAQALEGWVLQQAVTGLTKAGQLQEAEALCSQVLSLSPEHPALLLLLRQVQCERLLLSSAGTALPASVLEQLSSAVLANHTSLAAWHWLAEVYRTQGLLVQAVMAYRQSLQLASQLGLHGGQMASLLRLALLALSACMAKIPGDEWKELVLEATTEALKLGPSPVALLIQALLHFSTKMAARETRRLLERLVYAPSQAYPETVACVARWYLLRHLHAKDDLELMDTLVDQAKASADGRLLEFHALLTSG
uniref:Tetratricopeptide repeat domain 37 n=1 Tax=Esox lucius TaxID=8010 RepID=A0A6Q2Y8Y9_ESOLU